MRMRIKTKGATVEQVWELSGCRLQRGKKFQVGCRILRLSEYNIVKIQGFHKFLKLI